MLHCLLDRDNKADPLESEDSGPNKECPVLVIEVDNVRNALSGQSEKVIVIEVDESQHDEKVGNEGSSSQFRHISNHGHWEENYELRENQVFDFNELFTLCYRD